MCPSSFIVSFWHSEVRFEVLQGRCEEPWLSTPGSAAFPAFLNPQLQGVPHVLLLEASGAVAAAPSTAPLGQVCWASGRALCACRRHIETARSGESELAQILASPWTQLMHI